MKESVEAAIVNSAYKGCSGGQLNNSFVPSTSSSLHPLLPVRFNGSPSVS